MPLEIAAFDGLVLYRYRLTLRLARPLEVPSHRRAVLWRGAFGAVFRSLVCHDVALDCQACPLRSACPFPRVFAPSIPEGRPIIARLKDPPRPFVIADPHPAAPSLFTGERRPSSGLRDEERIERKPLGAGCARAGWRMASGAGWAMATEQA